MRYGLSAALILAAASGVWHLAGREGSMPRGEAAVRTDTVPPLEVDLVRAERVAVPVGFDYTGVIVSPQDAALRPRVTGMIVERPFEPGSMVEDGQILFRIDPRPFEVALQAAQAQRDQARAQLDFARLEVQRVEPLTGEGYASRQRLQQLESNLAVASARLQEAEAEVARQQLNLDYAVVRAPFRGRAGLSEVNVGDLVTANQTDLVSLVQIDPIDLQVALSAEASAAVEAAMTTGSPTVTVLAEDGRPEAEARIYKLDNRFNATTARRLVRAALRNEAGRFLPGEFVRTRIEIGTTERILVPTIALSAQLDRRIVYTADGDGTVQAVPVEVGDSHGDKVEILGGLRENSLVITSHLQSLRPGQRVALPADLDHLASGSRRMAEQASLGTR